jgi:hypothetical protein
MANLINCTSCETQIAKTAKACPKCGAENKYLHPMLKNFLASNPKVLPEIGLQAKGDILTGSIIHSRSIGVPMFIFGLIFFLASSFIKGDTNDRDVFLFMYVVQSISIFAVFGSVVVGIIQISRSKWKEFSLDLTNERFDWKCDDEKLFMNWKNHLTEYFESNYKNSKSA